MPIECTAAMAAPGGSFSSKRRATASTDFPTAHPLQTAYGGGNADGFVAKISADSSRLLYATYLGGGGDDSCAAIAVDANGSTYPTGLTTSTNFPTVNAVQPALTGSYNAFASKLSADGSASIYSTYLGGFGLDWDTAVAVDSGGNAYLTGYTSSPNFPTVNALQPKFGGGGFFDVFVTKLSADGKSLIYSTYLGEPRMTAAMPLLWTRVATPM